jgi:hypothetical protein
MEFARLTSRGHDRRQVERRSGFERRVAERRHPTRAIIGRRVYISDRRSGERRLEERRALQLEPV